MPSAATATPSSTVYATMNYAAGYAPAQYTAQQHQGYQNTPKSTTPYTPSHQYTAQGASYQHQPGYNATAAYAQPSTTQSAPAYPPVMPNPQPTQATQPPMMGPPMRWGFEHGNPAGSYPGVQASQRGPPRPFNTHGNPVGGGGQNPHANKRDHRSAFGKPQSVGPRVPAPPAVPSFGNPLPSKPPPPVDATRKPKKKKRKHNQLGLTPKTEDHESSEEEDDADEEAKLASGGSAAAAALQITYRGRTSTLNNPEEIAAWIAERKKRFPTKARVEEKKSAMEAAKKARDEALRQKKQDAKRTQKTPAKAAGDPVDEAAKAKQKADKLRRKLLKEQKRVEKAEADAERARMKVEQLQRASSAQKPPQPPTGTDAEPLPDQETQIAQPMQQPALAAENPPPAGTIPTATSSHKDVEPQDDDIDAALSSSDVSDISDWTSSSGSDSSSDSDESDDDDSAPEEATSRREGPERVAPPPREVKKRICRHFARNGRCTRGDKCKFLHEKPEKPERGPKSKPPEKSGRKGLLQAVSFILSLSCVLGYIFGNADRRVLAS